MMRLKHASCLSTHSYHFCSISTSSVVFLAWICSKSSENLSVGLFISKSQLDRRKQSLRQFELFTSSIFELLRQPRCRFSSLGDFINESVLLHVILTPTDSATIDTSIRHRNVIEFSTHLAARVCDFAGNVDVVMMC